VERNDRPVSDMVPDMKNHLSVACVTSCIRFLKWLPAGTLAADPVTIGLMVTADADQWVSQVEEK